jgi:hypothetical protein
MRAVFAAGDALLRQGASALGRRVSGAVPLRLDAGRGELVSALPRRLAKDGQPEALAQALAQRCSPAFPFQAVRPAGSMVVLELSGAWMESVLRRWRDCTPPVPPPLSGVRRCSREDDAFLLHYTALRCAALTRREGAQPEALPRRLVCLLAQAQSSPAEIARCYWALSPAQRSNPSLARAVGCRIAGDRA